MTSKRAIDAANETATLSKVVKPVYFCRADFSSGVQRWHTEIGPKTAVHPVHGSELYTGIGDFGGINGEVVESVSSAAQALKLLLSGVKSSLVNISITDDYYRREIDLMVGLENPNTGILVAAPEIIFSGFMDKADVTLDEAIGQIGLTNESRGSNLRSSSDQRFTDEDKQAEVTGDILGEYIYRMQDVTLRWGDQSFRSPFGPAQPIRDNERRRRGRGDLP